MKRWKKQGDGEEEWRGRDEEKITKMEDRGCGRRRREKGGMEGGEEQEERVCGVRGGRG